VNENRPALVAVPPEPPPAAGAGAPLPVLIPIRLPQIEVLEAKLDAILEGRCAQTWYTVEQAWRLKFAGRVGEEGSISLSTVKSYQVLQPKGGVPDAWISNRKVWKEASVEEWLSVDDAGLEAYLKRYNPRRAVPLRIKQALARRGPIQEES
jgi:hypothetical protein